MNSVYPVDTVDAAELKQEKQPTAGRRSSGVLTLLAEAQRRRQREQQAQHRAWQAAVRDQQKAERATARAAARGHRAAMDAYQAAQEADAARRTAELERHIAELGRILADGAARPPAHLGRLKAVPPVVPFEPGVLANPIPMPDQARYQVPSLTAFQAFSPAARREHADHAARAARGSSTTGTRPSRPRPTVVAGWTRRIAGTRRGWTPHTGRRRNATHGSTPSRTGCGLPSRSPSKGLLASVCFNGQVTALDPATGQEAERCLVSGMVRREDLGGLQPAVVDAPACLHRGATKGILVTTSGFGPGSYEFAQGKPLALINGAEPADLLGRHGLDLLGRHGLDQLGRHGLD